ncbi:Co2+/Mg2+ efflux protein ApaG [Pelagibaculum spongiae]|uniref:Protein ApaG n=1 Tax=Pelagibaculum spongiae TaxID=2080658 RepID=A0A2V1GRW5_9GAMM|nr:Co2+/Mg2+ efflux protein ApaG [Pelagibaculum spongiae]PVZ67741.1 Co2+/Mg2+ efflux protein ApaG [Pelagibaculum spongiae]
MNPTPQIDIEVLSYYLQEQSEPETGLYVFAYQITIRNLGQQPVQLLNRHWIITDGNGETMEVQGAGVVGEQPVIEPGKSFQYSSGTHLDTPVGTMQGSYEMIDAEKQLFQAEIPAFSLQMPGKLH